MRVVIVGSAANRKRLRGQLPEGIEVIAEQDRIDGSLVANTDAFLVAPTDQSAPEPLVERLTVRESQVLALLAQGMSNKTIAGTLAISDETVKFHLTAIFGKLAASNRTDAVRLAIRRGLVPL
jgi:DNA-binding NarL/FixJ family response regulator